MKLRGFGFSDGGSGSGGSGFNVGNSYTGVHDLPIGDTPITTVMTSKPKFVSFQDSTGTDISTGLVWQAVLSGLNYNIVVSTGIPLTDITINAYGA